MTIKLFHFCGHIISSNESGRFPKSNEENIQQKIDAYFKEIDVNSCYGSLASGADIMLAESLLKKGANIHIVLPFDKDDFLKLSVNPSGSEWKDRFSELINQAKSVTQIFYNKPSDNDEVLSFALCTIIAMGLSLIEGMKKKRILKETLKQIAIWDSKKTKGYAGTYPDMLRWNSIGLDTTCISSKKPIEIRELKIRKKINTKTFDIVVYEKTSDSNSYKIDTISELFTNIQSQPFAGNFYIDLDRERYGNINCNSENISNRALGVIAYECHLKKETDNLNTLVNKYLKIKT